MSRNFNLSGGAFRIPVCQQVEMGKRQVDPRVQVVHINGVFCRVGCQFQSLGREVIAVVTQLGVGPRNLGMGQRELRVQFHSSLIALHHLWPECEGEVRLRGEPTTPEVSLVGLEVVGHRLSHDPSLGIEQGHSELGGDPLGDLGLYSEDIRNFAVEAVCPKMAIIGDPDQLGGDAHPL